MAARASRVASVISAVTVAWRAGLFHKTVIWASAPWPRAGAAASGWRQPGSLAHSCRLGDNDGMARDDSGDRLVRGWP
jgi:hypothetical protein